MSGLASHRQSGVTLIVGLIMLVLITLLALSAMQLANTNLKIVGNEQVQDEAQAAATFALDAVANKSDLASVAASSTAVNVGQAEYTVVVTKPACKRYRSIPTTELSPLTLPDDAVCVGSTGTSIPIIGPDGELLSGATLCASTLWEAQASVSNANSGANSVVTDGIEQRVPITVALTSCS